ncbi:MAG TPA: acyl-CoA thioesterase, partial [Kiritimatiellia bacterium]|nr:acyl-CoA thioesterase [Kiritimatiellia bacterium]
MKKIPVPIYCHRFAFSAEAQDDNQHVNNIEYVRMLQESAIAHTRQNGWAPEELYARGWTWVVRSHFIEYLKPCRAGEEIALYTWAASFKKIRSLRRYRFVRVADRAVLAEAETDWVFVNNQTGRPMAIPP